MKKRRDFIKAASLLGAGVAVASNTPGEAYSSIFDLHEEGHKPLVISTWNHGMKSNQVSWEILKQGGVALDAVERGVRVVESDPTETSVGKGGLPDREGKVTLDASIMDHNQRCGAVAFLEHIENPISVARKVMEDTPHAMLAGAGAYKFAIEKGFEHTNLLTEDSEKAWKEWLKTSHYKPIVNIENHDTIGALAIDIKGNLAGACTTSGLSYKMSGRVGDSPLIGAGLFVDNEVGAACATGLGEAVIRVAGSAMIVELMRQGRTPAEACREMVMRIVKAHTDNIKDIQVGFLAINKYGHYGSYAVHSGFSYALTFSNKNELVNSPYYIK